MKSSSPYSIRIPFHLQKKLEQVAAGRPASRYIVEALEEKLIRDEFAGKMPIQAVGKQLMEVATRLMQMEASPLVPSPHNKKPKPANEVMVARKWREDWTKAVCYVLGRKLGPDLWDEKQKQGLEFFNAAHAWVIQQEKFEHEMTLADYVACLRGNERFEKLLSWFTPEALRFVGVDPSAEM